MLLVEYRTVQWFRPSHLTIGGRDACPLQEAPPDGRRRNLRRFLRTHVGALLVRNPMAANSAFGERGRPSTKQLPGDADLVAATDLITDLRDHMELLTILEKHQPELVEAQKTVVVMATAETIICWCAAVKVRQESLCKVRQLFRLTEVLSSVRKKPFIKVTSVSLAITGYSNNFSSVSTEKVDAMLAVVWLARAVEDGITIV